MNLAEHPARYLIALLVPLALAVLLTPAARWLAFRLDILDRPRDGRFHQRTTPFLGGLAVAVALIAVAALSSGLRAQFLTILAGGLAICLLGLIDDWRGVRPEAKLIVEAGAAVALWLAGVRAGIFGTVWLDLPLTVLWVAAVTNALNLVDNMDGLATGVAAVSALGFFGIAAQQDHFLVASLALAVSGACWGFLPHNFPPARIFLGDAGSLLLGFLLAALGLKLDLMGPGGVIRAAVPVLVLAVPLFDMAVVVITRLREGRPVYVGGTDHTSHRLAANGVSHRGVALIAMGTQLACSAVAVVLVEVSDGTFAIGVALMAAAALVAGGAVLRMGPQPVRTAVIERPVVVDGAPERAGR